MLKPLNLSYTQSKASNTGENGGEGGAPTKSNTSKTDKTITNTNGGTK